MYEYILVFMFYHSMSNSQYCTNRSSVELKKKTVITKILTVDRENPQGCHSFEAMTVQLIGRMDYTSI